SFWFDKYLEYFFFSSRRRHTRFSRDWSSDVCSSDLCLPGLQRGRRRGAGAGRRRAADRGRGAGEAAAGLCRRARGDRAQCAPLRSEERRVGKERRSRWWPHEYKGRKEEQEGTKA